MGARHRARAHAIQVNLCLKYILTFWLSDHPVWGRSSWKVQKASGHTDARQQDQIPTAMQGFKAGRQHDPGQQAQHLLWVKPLFSCYSMSCAKQEKLLLLLLDSGEQPKLILLVSEKWDRCLAEMAKQLIQLIIAGGQVNLAHHPHLHQSADYYNCRWWGKHLLRQCDRRSGWARRRPRQEAIAVKTPLSRQRPPGGAS